MTGAESSLPLSFHCQVCFVSQPGCACLRPPDQARHFEPIEGEAMKEHAIERPCPGCSGKGVVLVANGPMTKQCPTCLGSGLVGPHLVDVPGLAQPVVGRGRE